MKQGAERELWLPLLQHGTVRTLGVGQLIYQQEREVSCFYYLKSGKVKSFIQSEEGQERVLNIYHGGDLFGMASFFGQLPRMSSAVALEECKVISLDKNLVELELSRDPKLALLMMKYLARTVRLLSEQVDDMAFRPAPQRVARYLLLQGKGTGKVKATQDEIADSVSTSRVTVSRVLKKFIEQGWVETKYGEILLKATEPLKEFSQGDHSIQ